MAAWYCANRAKIRAVGPAGRLANAPKVIGRRSVSKSGGRIVVAGKMERRKDYFKV